MKKIPLYIRSEVVDYALVDDSWFEELSRFKWTKEQGKYARRAFWKNGKTHTEFMHRRIMGLSKGDNKEVDHINRNKLDNRSENLRLCERFQNMANLPKKPGCISQYKGLSKSGTTWTANIIFKGKRIFLGSYKTERDAAIAYNVASTLLKKEFAILNDLY